MMKQTSTEDLDKYLESYLDSDVAKAKALDNFLNSDVAKVLKETWLADSDYCVGSLVRALEHLIRVTHQYTEGPLNPVVDFYLTNCIHLLALHNEISK